MKRDEATPRPWQVERERSIWGGPGFLTEVIPWAEHTWNTKADMKLVVRAVNSHDALVAALRDLLEGMEASGGWKGDDGLFDAGMAALRLAEPSQAEKP